MKNNKLRNYLIVISLLLLAGAAVFAGNIARATGVSNDLDSYTSASLATDYTRAAQLPLTGWFTKTLSVNGVDRTVKVYIPEQASPHNYFSVIAVSGDEDTYAFLKNSGWLALADKKGESILALEPAAGGWGTAEKELPYVNAAIKFLGGTNNNGVSVFSSYAYPRITGYGKGAAPLEMYAAANPILVESQVYIGGEGAGKDYLAAQGVVSYDGTEGIYGKIYYPILSLDETLAKCGLSRMYKKGVPVPTWFVDYGASTSNDASLAYWKTANDCLSAAENGIYYQNVKSKALPTLFENGLILADNPSATKGVSQVRVSSGVSSSDIESPAFTASVYKFHTSYNRYGNPSAYANTLLPRLDYTEARVAAKKVAAATYDSGSPLRTISGDKSMVSIYGISNDVISGHGTVQVGIFAFNDNNGDGKNDPREYLAYVPESCKGKTVPVVIAYPGQNTLDSTFMDDSGWWQIAEKNSFVIVFVGETYAADNTPAILTHISHADSALYNYAVMSVLKDEIDGNLAKIDFTRIYGSGHSLGSMTTQGFARVHPEFYAAVASTSGFTVHGVNNKILITSADEANEPIPTYLMTGQSDLNNPQYAGDVVALVPNLFSCENLQTWATYLFKVNGLDTSVTSYDAAGSGFSDRYDNYVWKDSTGAPVVKWTQTMLRTHNTYIGEMPLLWDFLKHYKFVKNSDGTITRYYSASAFAKDDAVKLATSAGSDAGSSSDSSSGCNAGFGLLALLAVVPFAVRRKK